MQQSAPQWMRLTLVVAGIYNLAWGSLVVLLPDLIFNWAGMEPPRYPQIWQCVGMIVGVYGVGYLIAAGDPLRHWPIVLVGLLGKLFGPVGFVVAAAREELPWSWGATIVTNDLIWWLPFAAILWRAARDRPVDAGGTENTSTRLARQCGQSPDAAQAERTT